MSIFFQQVSKLTVACIVALSGFSFGDQPSIKVLRIVHAIGEEERVIEKRLAVKVTVDDNLYRIWINNISQEDFVISKKLSGWRLQRFDQNEKIVEEGGASLAADSTALEQVVLKEGETLSFSLPLGPSKKSVVKALLCVDFGLLIPAFRKYGDASIKFQIDK